MSGEQIIPFEVIEKRIFLIRGQKVILSTNLAELYAVEVRSLVQAVKRNIIRFPNDFMFQLTESEYTNLKSQIVISKDGGYHKNKWGGARRSTPYAFTEQGVAMLSSVLRSQRAVKINILIMRTFVKLREILSTHKELAQKLKELELKIETHDGQIAAIFETINKLLAPPPAKKTKIGFQVKENKIVYKKVEK